MLTIPCHDVCPQGWPKFIARQFAVVPPKPATSGAAGLAAVQYFESVSADMELGDGNLISVVTTTNYPFEDQIVFKINATKAFEFSVRIPAWCTNATIAVLASSVEVGAAPSPPLPAGAMHGVAIPEGTSTTVTLTLPLTIRVARRPAYALNASVSVDTNAANVFRGPLLYAIARDFVLDHSKPYDDAPGLLPIGQAHGQVNSVINNLINHNVIKYNGNDGTGNDQHFGQDNYLLGTGNWSYAIRINDDSAPEKDLTYVTVDGALAPPKGQGPFSAYLAPGHIKAKAQFLPDWGFIHDEYGGRGAPSKCEKGTSIPNYEKVWAGLPPKSPVAGACARHCV